MAISKKVKYSKSVKSQKALNEDAIEQGLSGSDSNKRLEKMADQLFNACVDDSQLRSQFKEIIPDLIHDKRSEELFLAINAGFKHLAFTLSEMNKDEHNAMEQVDDSLRFFLFCIKGQKIISRRSILDLVGNWVNQYFSKYIFISPEQTLLVDPRIHHSEGISSQNIDEGYSYAVILKENSKTVKYASIAVK